MGRGVLREPFSISIPGQLVRSTLHVPTGTLTTVSDEGLSVARESFGPRAVRRRPKGWTPPTSYSMVHYADEPSRGTARVRWRDYVYTYEGLIISTAHNGILKIQTDIMPGGSTWWSPAASHRDKALIKARLKMKSSSVNLGVAFAERRQTANLVGSTALRIAHSARALRRGDWKSSLRYLGVPKSAQRKPRGSSVTSQWLELQYGWLPLLSDVHGSCEALAKRPAGDWRVTAKGLSKEKKKDVRSFTASGSGSSCLAEAVIEVEHGYFVRIDALPGNPLTSNLVSLGIVNPAVIAWELVPFSFMVDWFLPIGQYLDSLDAMLGYREAYSSVTEFARGATVARGVNGTTRANNYMKTCEVNATDYRGRYVRVNRIAQSGVPLPALPRFRDGRSLTRMANALSILAQVFTRR